MGSTSASPSVPWGKVALAKVSESPDGDELFVLRFIDGSEIAAIGADGCLVSGELTEPAIRQLFRDAHRSHVYVNVMFRIARHLFDEQARRGETLT